MKKALFLILFFTSLYSSENLFEPGEQITIINNTDETSHLMVIIGDFVIYLSPSTVHTIDLCNIEGIRPEDNIFFRGFLGADCLFCRDVPWEARGVVRAGSIYHCNSLNHTFKVHACYPKIKQ